MMRPAIGGRTDGKALSARESPLPLISRNEYYPVFFLAVLIKLTINAVTVIAAVIEIIHGVIIPVTVIVAVT